MTTQTQLQKQRRDLSDTWLASIEPRYVGTIEQWAASSNIKMPPGLRRAQFDPGMSRHFNGPFEALKADAVREVSIAKPVRGGGTLISDIWHCWARANDAGAAMVILQDEKMAKEHFRDRLRPMMEGSDRLRALLPDDRHGVTTDGIRFKDGLPMFIAWPSVGKLQSKAIRYITCDEVWVYKRGIVAEAEGRLGDFLKDGLSKLLLVSQGGEEDDDFHTKWDQGSREEWEVACLKCGGYFQPKFKHGDHEPYSGLRWDEHKDDDGNWQVEECLRTVRYVCPLCGHEMADGGATKGEWNGSGRYAVTNPNAPASKRSFHWPGTIDWPWVELVSKYLSARNAMRQGVVEPTIQFWQKYMAERKTERTVIEGGADLRQTKADTEGGFIRILCNDRQASELYYSAAFKIEKGGAIDCIWFGKLIGGAAIKEKADELKCGNVMIDSGFEAKGAQGVYSICARHHSHQQKWFATKGTDDPWFWHQVKGKKRVMRSYSEFSKGDPEAGTAREGSRFAILYRFSSDIMNERLDGLVNSRRFTLSAGQPQNELDEFKSHMGSEYRKQKRDDFTGKVKWVWACPSGKNHYRDCARQAVLAAIMAGELVDQTDVVDVSTSD